MRGFRAENEREEWDEAELSVVEGLAGDNWSRRPANSEGQLTLMNAWAAQSRDRWFWAGDQLYVELYLSDEHIPAGTRIAIGADGMVELTVEPHPGCEKFISRFGLAAMKLVNSPLGRSLNLRGINTKVIPGGTIRRRDAVRRLAQG